MAVEFATHRLSGTGAWFEPQSRLTHAVRVFGVPPPRWTQAITSWLGYFPLSVSITHLVIAHLGDLPLVLKTSLATPSSTPLMVSMLLPWITARLARWPR
ncbi:hypothetical protein [Gordonia oryzae]|uniref:hypothetical protein n=1 Tax=Gordonia oryzae TaxID=2487349 RepID=UPI001FEAF9B5|nr:hypothetical protein [Gordonia oryzae]